MKWSEIIAYYEAKSLETSKSKDAKTKYIVASYQKIVNTLKTDLADSLDEDVTEDVIQDLNISDHMKGKLKYFKENPRDVLKFIAKSGEDDSKTPDIKSQLLELLGIGDVKADELIAVGLKTISQLKTKKFQALIPEVTQKMLVYPPDRLIPHESIKAVEPAILSLCDSKDGCLSTVLVGSYRRRTATSRDIDVMIVSDDEKILDTWLAKARSTFGNDNVIPYAAGPDKLSVLIRFDQIFPAKKLGVYKLDVFRAPTDKAHSMMLYATGSKGFNIIMRKKAKEMKMLLNQDGLFDRETNKPIPTANEHDIFETLGMEYKEPWERN
jgi:DNA polymerase/3'-5' exonuclease PolX